MRRRLVTALAALALLGAPSAAVAQSAGDDQYLDPLAGEDTQQPTAQAPETSTDTPAPAPSTGANTAGTGTTGTGTDTPTPPADTAGAGPQAGSQDELPRTGLPLGVVAGLGASLLAGGVALRRGTSPTP